MFREDIASVTQGVKRQNTTISSVLMNPKARKVYHKLYQQLQEVAQGPEGEAGHQGGISEGSQDIHRTEKAKRITPNK